MVSQEELENDSVKDCKPKFTLKATSEVRKAFDELSSSESFLTSSEVILKYVSSLLPPSEEDLDELPEDVIYVIKRLISSLASQRLLIREGSYSTLQVMLQLYPQILPFTVSYIELFYGNKKDNTKEKHCDYAMGHILALGAIIRSGCALEEVSCIKRIIKNLLKLKVAKFSTDPVAGQFLVDLVSMYKEENTALKIWKEAQKLLEKDVQSLSPSLMRLRIILARDQHLKTFSNVDSDFQRKTFDQSTYVLVLSKFKKLYQVHVNITPMLEDYFQSLLHHSENCDGEEKLASFFSVAITPTLNTAGPKDIVLVFNLTQVALSYLKSKKRIETVLSPELIETLIESSSENEEVEASARGLLSAILQLIIRNKESGSKIQLSILKWLISSSAKLNFDSVSKTTVLQQAIDHLSVDTIVNFAKIINSELDILFVDEETERYEHKFYELFLCCKWISKLVSHPTMIGFNYHTWKAEQVSQLFKVTFCRNISKEQCHIKEYYLGALNQITSNIEWQALFVEQIVEKVRLILENDDNECLNLEDKNLFLSTSQKLKKLKTDVLSVNDLAVFKILYGHISLHVFIDSKNSEELIQEVKECYNKAVKAKKQYLNKKEAVGNEPQWMEVVVDLLLSIVSKDEQFWRKIVNVIFKHICHALHPDSLSLLTDIINPEKNDVILEAEEEIGSDGEEEHVGDESMDVDEEMEDEDENCDDESDDSDESEDEDSDLDEEEQINIINVKKKMQELVGPPVEDVELNSVPQEDLNKMDRQLGTLIGKLIALKKKRKVKKMKMAKDETALMCFRTRVCDLLETLIREAPSLEHILPLISPIMSAYNKSLEDNLQKHLLEKLKSLISEIVKVKKCAKPTSISAEGLGELLKNFFESSKKLSNKLRPEIGSCCLFFIRSGMYLTSEENTVHSDTIMEVYTQYLETSLKEMNVDIIDSPINLETSSIRLILKKLLETVFKNSIKPFKKKKGIEMIKQIFNNEQGLRKIPPQEMEDLLQTLKMEIVNAFNDVKQSKQVQSNYLLMLLDLLKTLKKVFKSNPEMEEKFGWNDVMNSLSAFAERVSLADFKELRKTLVILGNIIGWKLKSLDDPKRKTSKVAEIPNSVDDGSSSTSVSKKSRENKKRLEHSEEKEDVLAPVSASEEVKEESSSTKKENKRKRKEEAKANKKQKKETKINKEESDVKTKENDQGESLETEEKTKKMNEEKTKKKKKRHNHDQKIKQNAIRLYANDDLKSFCFADVVDDL